MNQTSKALKSLISITSSIILSEGESLIAIETPVEELQNVFSNQIENIKSDLEKRGFEAIFLESTTLLSSCREIIVIFKALGDGGNIYGDK